MLRINPNAQKTEASVVRLPFQDNSFDLATCSMLVHHLTIEEQQIAIKEMQRVSRKYVFFSEPNRNNLSNLVFAL